jgi:predicted Zn-dependent peptidase
MLTPSVLALALCASIGATANAQAATVTHVTTSPGVGVTIISQPDAAATLVHASFILRAGLDRQTLMQNGLAALTAQTILRTPIDGKPVQDAIAAHGGSIQAFVDPGDVRFAIEALPQDASAVFLLAQKAITRPQFDAQTVDAARATLTVQIAQNQQEALSVGLDMLYGTRAADANTGMPSLGIPASLAQLGPRDVQAFYAAFYRSGDSVISGVGRLDALAPFELADLASGLAAGVSKPVVQVLPKLEGTSRQLVTHRDVAAPWLIAQYPAPAVGSKDFGAMLVLSAFVQRTLADMAEVPGVVSPTFASRAVGALYQYDRLQPNLTLYVNGGIGNPDRAFGTALSIATLLATTRLEGSIDQFKAQAAGDFSSGVMTLEARAWLAAVFVENGQSPDYVGQTLAAIQATDASDLQRVAKTYLESPTIALVLPRDKQ